MEGFEARALTWAQLGMEVGLDCSDRTIQRAMETLNYRKCVACKKFWVNERLKEKRRDWADYMLKKYPDPEDWKRVRFSDECHFGYGQIGKLRIIRKPKERYCPECIQENDPKGQPSEKDQKRFHVWAAIGWNFKSDLVFYDVPGNSNGKISLQVYHDEILEPVVGSWLRETAELGLESEFVLEEDGDSGHGGGKRGNICQKWKEEHHLKHYFNCPGSPDLSIIENCWQIPKQYSRKFPHWDDHSTKSLILEGWKNVSTEFINERVLDMPNRLRAVRDGKGKMTGY